MSNWRESLNERMRREQQAELQRQMQASRSSWTPEPSDDGRSDKDRERELRRVAEELGFKGMLEDVKRNIWEGRGKISSNFFPDDVYYTLHQKYKKEVSGWDGSPDGRWVDSMALVDKSLVLGAKRVTEFTKGLRFNVNASYHGGAKPGDTLIYLNVFYPRALVEGFPQDGSCEFPYDNPGAPEELQQELLDQAYRNR